MNGRFLGTIRSASFKWIADTCKKNKITYYDWHIREKLVQKIITHECILFVIDIRPFDTISDFSISKLKWCPNHMDYKFKEFSGLAFLSLANRPSEVWPFFHFEFSLPLLWLVDSKFLRKYFSKILNRPIREEIGKIQNSIIKFLSSDFRIWCNLVF